MALRTSLLPRLGCCLLLLVAAPAAIAQRSPATWTLGVKGGLTQAWLRPKEDGNSRVAPAFGVSVGRQFPALRIGLYADAFYEGRRFVVPGRWEASDLSYLVIPVYVRTGKPEDRLHVQLGATYAVRLTRALVSPLYQDWQVHQNEWGALAGMEIRVGRNQRIETTLGTFVRWSISSTLEQQTPRTYSAQGTTVVGLTLNGYWHGRQE